MTNALAAEIVRPVSKCICVYSCMYFSAYTRSLFICVVTVFMAVSIACFSFSLLHSQSGVAGLYFISCSGPSVTREDVASLQCVFNPPNCTQSISRPSAVVSNYVRGLEEPPGPTSTVVLPTTTTPQPSL